MVIPFTAGQTLLLAASVKFPASHLPHVLQEAFQVAGVIAVPLNLLISSSHKAVDLCVILDVELRHIQPHPVLGGHTLPIQVAEPGQSAGGDSVQLWLDLDDGHLPWPGHHTHRHQSVIQSIS